MIASILSNLRNTVIVGFVLAFVVFLIYLTQTEFNNYVFWPFLVRWFHIISGIMWIGMLWYFNFVQTPTMPKIPDELKGGVSRFIAPQALFWFRWGAMATIGFGIILAALNGYLLQAITLDANSADAHVWLGIALRKLNRTADAHKEFLALLNTKIDVTKELRARTRRQPSWER